jgi:AcrR family transcriptional regulator
MAYSNQVKQQILQAAEGLGKDLGQQALRLDFSVPRIAKSVGATRQTVYNWFSGGPVAPYYREKVQTLLDILLKSHTAEQAWREACARFQLIT